MASLYTQQVAPPTQYAGFRRRSGERQKHQSTSSQLRWSALPPGRFECVERLGHGAFASVYKAYDTVLRKYVALKRIKVTGGSAAFTKELTLARRCSAHPNIVSMLDYFEGETHSFMEMELASVEDMFERLTPNGKGLTQEEGSIWMRQLTHAVYHVHQQHVVHGDIKPENILLDGNNNVKLCDFGLAQSIGARLHAPIPGTACYMSPEQIYCDSANIPYEYHPAADVWGLGIVLYAMLFADLPWERAASTDRDFAKFCRRGGFKRSRQPFNMLSVPLYDMLSRMLSVDPHTRCTMVEVVEFFATPTPWFVVEVQAPVEDPSYHHAKHLGAESVEVQSAVSNLSLDSGLSGLSAQSVVSGHSALSGYSTDFSTHF
eukprot:m.5224 g.5224  ORF g.5224 m.5224 type:complete len:375 (-) comp4861_c2_seq1:303-1427(-)